MNHSPNTTTYGIAMDAVFDSAFQDMQPHLYIRPTERFKRSIFTYNYTRRCLCDQKIYYLKKFN
jgi:hypothetical protein